MLTVMPKTIFWAAFVHEDSPVLMGNGTGWIWHASDVGMYLANPNMVPAMFVQETKKRLEDYMAMHHPGVKYSWIKVG